MIDVEIRGPVSQKDYERLKELFAAGDERARAKKWKESVLFSARYGGADFTLVDPGEDLFYYEAIMTAPAASAAEEAKGALEKLAKNLKLPIWGENEMSAFLRDIDRRLNMPAPRKNLPMKIKIKKLKDDAKLPKYHHPGDVGMDMYAMETVTIKPGEHHRFYHGFALEFSEGYAAIVKDKSSISNAGLHTMGGVFDAGFRGEYNTHVVNLGSEPYTVEAGDKVAQLVIYPVVIAELEETDTLNESARGTGSFGSTGKK